MLKKVKGFLIQSTARSLDVAPGPKQAFQTQVVLVEESLPKAMKEAVEQCPTGMELISLSVTELAVWMKE
jgi:hypothetical protein